MSAIIPAYNEASRILAVLELAVSFPLFSEVIVVDDGSKDQTRAVAEQSGATVIQHERNQGKPAAMLTGLKAATSQVVCFLDADLTDVTSEHLESLVLPVLRDEAPATLAIFTGGKSAAVLAQKICPMLSGQRCLQRELLADFAGWGSGFGIETAINSHLLRRGVEQLLIDWPGAGQVHKEEKRGWIVGFIERLGMYREIITTWLRTKLRRV